MGQGDPPLPPDEEARLACLGGLGILDTPPDPAFDRLTRLASRHFGTPVALVSLVDAGRQWFKSRHGLEVAETPRRVSFCAYAILGDAVMVVPDATRDPRFAANPLVTGPPGIRFYAGAPLLAGGGLRLGTFCVIDYRPRRDFGPAFAEDLAEFARLAVREAEAAAARRAEREARAGAERASLAKTKFLAAASHDLRQPVQSLLLLMGVLEGQVAGTPAARTLAVMGEALDGLRGLLDGLLDLSRLDAGIVAVKPAATPIRPLLDRLAHEYGPRAAARGLRLRAVGCGGVVLSDPVLLERILRNLLENAVRHTERGGILLGCRRQGSSLRVEVLDTGPGIPAERQGEVFEEFVQLGNPERDRAKGLGLGLAVVRRLAGLLGHRVSLRSVPGRGSAFAVTVPLAGEVPGPATLVPKSPPGPARGRVVLVVDDEAVIRLGLQALVAGWGHRVLAAGSLAEVGALLDGGAAPDAVLADYRLRGGETGLDVVRAVRDRQPGRAVPAAILTGDTDPARLAEARASGCALLHKPVPAAQLRAALADLLAGAAGAPRDAGGPGPPAAAP